jgi:transcription termination factor Rho
MRDAAAPPVRDMAPPVRDVAAPRDRGERMDRPERTDRPERSERPDRGGRDRSGPRMPMADFDDAETPPARTPRDEVGQLESLDSVLGDDRGGGRRDRRRPRRDA